MLRAQASRCRAARAAASLACALLVSGPASAQETWEDPTAVAPHLEPGSRRTTDERIERAIQEIAPGSPRSTFNITWSEEPEPPAPIVESPQGETVTHPLGLEDWLPRSPLEDPKERAHRIALFPVARVTSPSLLPPQLRKSTWRRWARTLETFGVYDDAARAYAWAIGLGQRDVALWRGLGRTRVRNGDWEAAESAFLAGFQRALELSGAGREVHPEQALVLRELGELYLLMQRVEAARNALEASLDLHFQDTRTQALLDRARYVLLMDDEEAAEGLTFVALWPESGWTHTAAQLDRGLGSVHRALPGFAQTGLSGLSRHMTTSQGVTLGFVLVLACMIGLLVARRFRGRGDLTVNIEYPQELRGTFSVHLGTQQGFLKRGEIEPGENRVATANDHFLITRETQFKALHPRRYWVVLIGRLEDPETGRALTEPFEERAVVVRAGETSRLDADLGPRECAVDVKVLWEKRAAPNAGVSVYGRPNSLRYTKGGDLRLRLGLGPHTVVVGSGDRIAEQTIEIDSFSARSLSFELGDPDSLVFKGCPHAVAPYLNGDLNGAARALDRDGQERESHLLLARLHEERRHPRRAAEQFEAAEDWVRAAELRASISQFAHAADLYRRAGAHSEAGEHYRKSGDWLSAGDAFDTAGEPDKAVHCYKQAGETTRWIDALEKYGRFYEAAEVALTNDDATRGIQLLQNVGMTDSQYAAACLALSDLYEGAQQPEMAAERLEAHMAHAGDRPPELQARLANLYEMTGEVVKALEALECVQRTHPDFPEIDTRVETLRKKCSQQPEGSLTESHDVSTQSLANAFEGETRYEILEELGRGGMGVVLKARDTRLNRVVALKRLPENLRQHPRAIELFMREAQAAARLNHRNIVTVYDTDHENGIYFITMELLEGRPLNAILRETGPISARDVARLGIQIAAGLHYAHSHSVIHRDIKTANLFLTVDRTVKIMDFGLAKMIEQVRRESTIIGGTPYYMAPEQAIGKGVDHRTDIYALGITFYELLTGTVPFREGDVAYHHRHTDPQDPRERIESIPDTMAELVQHMIQKDIAARCDSAADVARRLEPLARS